MLLEIDESIPEELMGDEARADGDVLRRAMQNIATARVEGKHVVYGSRSTLSALAECDRLDERAKATFGRIRSRVAELHSLYRKVVMRVKVVSNGRAEGELEEGPNGRNIVVDARQFTDTSFIQPCILLCEHMSDGRYYILMGRVASDALGFANVRIAPTIRHGGGGATAAQYGHIQARAKRLCICILDSDKKSEAGGIGGTARSVRRRNDPERPLCQYRLTESREVENLIPTPVISDVSNPGSGRRAAYRALRNIERSQYSDRRQYLDVKRGTKLANLFGFAEDSPEADYWKPALRDVATNGESYRVRCLNRDECEHVRIAHCRCVVV